MIDSVLKGTGNSRFLKSAVPAGTSWADALAMLQAGTFPIDFNGINTEGFQQVGTPLNKANLLKDATTAQIGLPPSTTPDGMFRALGNTGELHVWRKTVVTKKPIPEVPGSYTLGTSQQLIVATRTSSNTSRGSQIRGVLASNSLSIDMAGNVSLGSPATISILVTGRGNPTETASAILSGYTYFMIPDSAIGDYCDITMPRNTVYFVSPSAIYDPASMAYGEQSKFNAAQLVTGVPGTPAIPAEITITYPVSTNPNAYQEGDDAKAAGYVVGEVVTGNFILGQANAADAYLFYKASSPTVSDDGTIEFDKNQYIQIGYAENWTASTLQAAIRGQFLQRGNSINVPSSYVPAGTIYIPNDAVVTRSNDNYIVSKYQPVTGYAAIPAGTTIEYLGKLGDKARVQVVSYVGMGTYGESNPCSLTFDFVPKLIIVSGYYKSNSLLYGMFLYPQTGYGITLQPSYSGGGFFGRITCKTSGKTVSWYADEAGYQLNLAGVTYTAIAIG